MPSKNASTNKNGMKTPIKKNGHEEVLSYDKGTGYVVPQNWKYPYFFDKKNYVAVIIGLNDRYGFERIFCEKVEFESGGELMVGFNPSYFKDGLIIEEKFSYKEHNTFITKTNYYRIQVFENAVWGKKIPKTEIREVLKNRQLALYEEIKQLMKQFGENFTLYTMESILQQRKKIRNKYAFFDSF